jgi:hypothetical protein
VAVCPAVLVADPPHIVLSWQVACPGPQHLSLRCGPAEGWTSWRPSYLQASVRCCGATRWLPASARRSWPSAHLGVRTIGDLERGVSHSLRKDTIALLPEALALRAPERAAFAEAVRPAPNPSANAAHVHHLQALRN